VRLESPYLDPLLPGSTTRTGPAGENLWNELSAPE